MALVDVEDAKAHLRITDTDHDADVAIKVSQASAIIVNYLKSRADPLWNETTTPLPVQAATLLLLTHLWEHRGDDMDGDEKTWTAIERILVRYRDPALA